jgi:hypothetical protein
VFVIRSDQNTLEYLWLLRLGEIRGAWIARAEFLLASSGRIVDLYDVDSRGLEMADLASCI